MSRASVITAVLADKVASALRNGDDYPKAAHGELQRLGDSLRAIQPTVRSADSMKMFRNPIPYGDPDGKDVPALAAFINRVRDAVYDADDVLDRLAYRILQGKAEGKQVSKFVSHARTVVERLFSFDRDIDELCEVVYRFDKLVTGMGEVVKSADLDSDDYVVSQHQPMDRLARPIPVNPGESQLVGRAGERVAILDFLMGTGPGAQGTCSQGNVQVLAILGLGGIGKTTLADWAYNHPIVEQNFALRAWIHVSDQFELERIMAEIAESASIETPHDFHHSQRLDIIQEVLRKGLQGRRFLIVLDDVWNVDVSKWEILLRALKFGGEGSRVLVTTRILYTARMMGTMSPFCLRALTEDDCWSLFSVYAFGDESENLSDHPEMEAIAREIAKRSGGLPLTAKMLGSLLKSNFNISYWRSIQHNRLWRSDSLNPTLPAFQICYEELPEHLKQCFAYCSLFPSDYGFEKDRLVMFWMALGFILPSEEKKLEDVGRGYFDELSQRCFFQKKQYQDGYGIHDLLHDLAISVSREECFGFDDYHHSEIPERVRHLKIHAANLNEISKNVDKIKHVHSLIINGRFRTDSFVDILQKFKGLRVLVLSGVDVDLLPESMGDLIHLRYLVLHKLDVEKLPQSVCRLYHLQGLDVRSCANLLTLPSELQNLVNLRHLKQ